MPSLFDIDYAAAVLRGLLAAHGTTAIYTPAGGAPVSVIGMVSPVELVEEETAEGTQEAETTTLTITTDPNSPYGGVAAPAIRDTVQIDSVDWDVDEVATGRGSAILKLVRDPSVEKSRPNFRQ